jgi:hypothetical protein
MMKVALLSSLILLSSIAYADEFKLSSTDIAAGKRFCRSKARWPSKYDCYVLLMKRESRTGWRQKAAFCLHTSSALS